MTPIPFDFIGPETGKIAVRFNNGVEEVVGHVVKQTGVRRYVVSDNTKEYVVTLARTLADAIALPEGAATILCYPIIDGATKNNPEHIKTLTTDDFITVEGHRFNWREANIARIEIPRDDGIVLEWEFTLTPTSSSEPT